MRVLHESTEGDILYGWRWIVANDDRGKVILTMRRDRLLVFGLRCIWTAIWGAE